MQREGPGLVVTLGLLGVLALGVAASYTVTGISLRAEHGEAALLCGEGFLDCTATLTGSWSKVLGVRLSTLSSFMFVLLLLQALLRGLVLKDRKGAFLFTLFVAYAATLVSLFYFVVSVALLKTVCLYCAGLYLLVAATLALSVLGVGTPLREQPALFRQALRVKQVVASALCALLAAGAVTLGESVRARPPQQPLTDIVAQFLQAEKVTWRGSETLARVGPADAPLQVVEFADFACPACRRAAYGLDQMRQAHPDEVSVTFVNFPLCSDCNPAVQRRFHPLACLAAEIALALEEDQFWAYTREVYALASRRLDEDTLMRIANSVGGDTAQIRQRISSGETRAALEQECALGAAIGVRATPALLVNGRLMLGALSKQQLEQILLYEKNPGAYSTSPLPATPAPLQASAGRIR